MGRSCGPQPWEWSKSAEKDADAAKDAVSEGECATTAASSG
jgi:hypothetical protein